MKIDDKKPKQTRVFISYSHDSVPHADRVYDLASRLRGSGLDVGLDQFEKHPREGWPLWSEMQIRDADFVILVCTPIYEKRFDDKELRGKGKGVKWEASIIRQVLYEEETKWDGGVPVVFGDSNSVVPVSLRKFTIYKLWSDYKNLHRRLCGLGDRVGEDRGRTEPLDVEIPARPLAQVRLETAEKILKVLKARKGLTDCLALGLGTTERQSMEALVDAVLDMGSPAVLADRFLTVAKRLDPSVGTSQDLAAGLREVFELALPVVAGSVLSACCGEGGVLTLGAEHPQTIEPRVAHLDGRRVQWRPKVAGKPPEPLALLDLDPPKPEHGMLAEERLEYISEEHGLRLFAIAFECLQDDGRGMLRFSTLEKRLKFLNDTWRKRSSRPFALVQETEGIEEREFLKLARDHLGAIRQIVPGTTDDEEGEEDNSLLVNLLEFYRELDRIEGRDP